MPRIGFFLPLAVAEHVLVILFSAWLIYQPPSLKIEETEYLVEIFKEEPPPEKRKSRNRWYLFPSPKRFLSICPLYSHCKTSTAFSVKVPGTLNYRTCVD